MASLLFTLCSIPIITIGTSWCAVSYVFLKRRRRSDESVPRLFFHAFKENFKKSTLAWLIVLLLLVMLRVDLYIFDENGPYPSLPLFVVICAFLILVLAVAVYLFPVIASFENTLKNLTAQAAMFAAGHIPTTFVMLAVPAVGIAVTFTSAATLTALIPVWIAAGFGLIALMNSYLLIRIFTPYLGPVDDSGSPVPDSKNSSPSGSEDSGR